LKAAHLTIVAPEVGEFVTSLDMAGCSLTLTWLDEELESLWLAPIDTPVLRRGSFFRVEPAPAVKDNRQLEPEIGPATPESQAGGRCIASLLDAIAQAMREAEEELGRIDAQAGDGDHGQGMRRGSSAAAQAAREASARGAGAATALAMAGDAWADRAGGTSGALWGLALRAWSGALADDQAVTPAALAAGAAAARDAIQRLGGAKVGDKTMVDALEPFVTTLAAQIGAGRALPEAWREAALAAGVAAAATAELTPKLGRARPLAERSIGHPDAGAVSLAICAKVAGEFIPSA